MFKRIELESIQSHYSENIQDSISDSVREAVKSEIEKLSLEYKRDIDVQLMVTVK